MQDWRDRSTLAPQVYLPSTVQVDPGGVCVAEVGDEAGAGVVEGGAGSGTAASACVFTF